MYMTDILRKINEIINVIRSLTRYQDEYQKLILTTVFASGNGRFGNVLIRNFAVYTFLQKFNCDVIYETMEYIGLDFVSSCSIKKTKNLIKLNDQSVIQVLQDKIKLKNNHIYHIHQYCQQPEILKEIVKHIMKSELLLKYKIFIQNKYEDFYSNNDLFIHIRGHGNFPEAKWFLKVINIIKSSFEIEKIFISYDVKTSIVNEVLVNNKDIIDISKKSRNEIINFGSSRKYLIISSGSFSYIIGLLASINSSKIYLNSDAGRICRTKKKVWHPQYYQEVCRYDPDKYIDVQ